MSPSVTDTPLAEIPRIYQTLKDTFKAGKLRPLSFRRAQLAQLAYLLQDNYKDFQKALFQDFGKHPIEANMGELACLFQRTLDAISNLEKWTEDVDLSSDTHPMFSASKPTLIKQPRGPVLIIGLAAIRTLTRFMLTPAALGRSMHPYCSPSSR